MRPQLLISALVTTTLALTGCQIDEVDFHDDEIGSSSQAIIGAPGAQEALAHHDAVAAITILLPPTSPETTVRTAKRYCTGVLVGADVVMTAATCLWRNLEAELDDEYEGSYLDAESIMVQFNSRTSTNIYSLDSTFVGGPSTEKGLTMHRYYDFDSRGTDDVALLKLSAVPVSEVPANGGANIVPASVSLVPATMALVGEKLELVGFGKNDNEANEDELGPRRFISPTIEAVSPTRITAGVAGLVALDGALTTCYADSGGPGFYDFGSGPVVISLSEVHGTCETLATRERVDLFASDFVQPFVDFYVDNCGGAGCADCDLNGVCEEDCPTRDWDCEIGSFTGDGCAKSGDCEEGGECVPATDDPEFTYCSKACTEGDATGCPSTMACVGEVCVYDGISPGSQGAVCSSPIDCRSGFCEDLVCANTCDAGDANSCDPANNVFCLPSNDDASTTVCKLQSRSGGGGFCSIGPAGSSNSRGALAGFGLIFMLGLLLRRRR